MPFKKISFFTTITLLFIMQGLNAAHRDPKRTSEAPTYVSTQHFCGFCKKCIDSSMRTCEATFYQVIKTESPSLLDNRIKNLIETFRITSMHAGPSKEAAIEIINRAFTMLSAIGNIGDLIEIKRICALMILLAIRKTIKDVIDSRSVLEHLKYTNDRWIRTLEAACWQAPPQNQPTTDFATF